MRRCRASGHGHGPAIYLRLGCLQHRSTAAISTLHACVRRHWGPHKRHRASSVTDRCRTAKRSENHNCFSGLPHKQHTNTDSHHAPPSSMLLYITCHGYAAAVVPRREQRCRGRGASVTASTDFAPFAQHREGLHPPPHIPPWDLQVSRAASPARCSKTSRSVHARR
jgi:hypothetical protein